MLKQGQTPLFHYIQSLVTETVLAEDVLQEVFLWVCCKLHWLREPELFRPWSFRLADSLRPQRFNTRLMSLFTALTLTLAVIGLYGVLAYSVVQRARNRHPPRAWRAIR